MPEKTFTAPLAIIKLSNGETVGKMRNLSFTENISRGEVQGIGSVVLQEAPVISVRCQFTAESYMIDLKKLGTVKDPFFSYGNQSNVENLLRTILLGEEEVDIHVYRRVKGSVDANGVVTSEAEDTMGVARNCLLNTKTWQVSEGQVSGKNISGIYFDPIQ